MKAANWIFTETNRISVHVVGCGGTGSLVLHGLAKLNIAMRSLGRPELDVTAIDGDTVSAANLGRQLFYRSDLGKNKAEVLIERINFAFGTEWKAEPLMLGPGSMNDSRGRFFCFDGQAVVIGCVDTRAARKHIRGKIRGGYYLDCGNGPDFGQVVLGETLGWSDNAWRCQLLPVWMIHPELFEGEDSAEDGPSCSLAEAIHKQRMFINDTAALYAMRILSELLLYGSIPAAGWYFNTTDGAKPLAPRRIRKHQAMR